MVNSTSISLVFNLFLPRCRLKNHLYDLIWIFFILTDFLWAKKNHFWGLRFLDFSKNVFEDPFWGVQILDKTHLTLKKIFTLFMHNPFKFFKSKCYVLSEFKFLKSICISARITMVHFPKNCKE